MTLISTMSVGSMFVAMTSDKRVSSRVFGKDVPIEHEKLVKVHNLNQNVLFGWGGFKDPSDLVREEIVKRIHPNSDLADCKIALEDILKEIEIHVKVAILLSGFYSDGTTGMVMYNSNENMVKEKKLDQLEYNYSMIPPTKDYSENQDKMFYLKEFIEPKEMRNFFGEKEYRVVLQRSIDVSVNRLYTIHGVISHKQPKEVTPEGQYYIIYRDSSGGIQTLCGSYDTLDFQKELEKSYTT
jgi:hypothetical protein